VSADEHPGAEGECGANAAAWFSRLGRPLTATEERLLRELMRGHAALADVELRCVRHWHEARDFVLHAEADATWWNHEEEERVDLWERAAERYTENELLVRLDAATAKVSDAVRAAAAAAAAREGIVDAVLVRCAADAALMAVHQHALAALAGEGASQLFGPKYALFAAGHWPLGCHRGTYAVF